MSEDRYPLAVGDRVRWCHPVHDKFFPDEKLDGTVKRVSESGFSVLWDGVAKVLPYGWCYTERARICVLPAGVAA